MNFGNILSFNSSYKLNFI